MARVVKAIEVVDHKLEIYLDDKKIAHGSLPYFPQTPYELSQALLLLSESISEYDPSNTT